MIQRLRYAAVAVLAVWLSASAAAAQSVVEALTDFGFFGTWAMHCGEPPAPGNIMREVSASPDGTVSFESTIGQGRGNRYVIHSVRRVDPTTAVLRVDLNGSEVQDLTVVKDGNRMRTMANQNLDGRFVVKDGIILATGAATPWLSRCGGSRTRH